MAVGITEAMRAEIAGLAAKAWPCDGCASLFRRLGGSMRCGHPQSAHTRLPEDWQPNDAAPHWCPRSLPPLLPRAVR